MHLAEKLTLQLVEAVECEINFQYEEEKKRLGLAKNELRKLGLCLFPVTIINHDSINDGETLIFSTSYTINDAYFKRGCTIAISINDVTFKGRLIELDQQSGTVFFSEELPENLSHSSVQINYIPDDRTLTCMRLGARLSEEHPQLKLFKTSFFTSKSTETFSHISLNESQQKVVGAILSDDETTLIQGPPGTGKSHTLAIAIQEIVKRGKKVIVTAPSNTAIDQLCLKLIGLHIPLLRIGNETKFDERLLAFTIDTYLEKGSHGRVMQHLEKSLKQASQIATRTSRSNSKELADEKRNARNELYQLRKEIRQLKRSTINSLLSEIPVIAGTPVALFNELPKDFTTDYVIIDEAGQALAPLAWLSASFGKKLVLCGDPQQLPPVVLSDKAKKMGLGKSLLEQISIHASPLLLDTQYRMATEIVQLINPFFYDNQLKTHPSTGGGEIRFIDLAGFGDGEKKDDISGSIAHPTAVSVIKQLISLGDFDPKTTIILAPYSAQIAALKKELGATWNVATIDAVQGNESDSIILCLTRSNEEQEIGFLRDYRRTNVAISRAKKRCYILGDSATIGNDPFYNSLIEKFEVANCYESVWERFSEL